jgi:imidazole glycerol-phosphate synthase subunit HisH
VPHVGWNEVWRLRDCRLFDGVVDGADFYFVHSFRFVPSGDDHVLATTPYAGGFTSVIGDRFVWGTQFHPEKSGRSGLRLLSNFLEPPC